MQFYATAGGETFWEKNSLRQLMLIYVLIKLFNSSDHECDEEWGWRSIPDRYDSVARDRKRKGTMPPQSFYDISKKLLIRACHLYPFISTHYHHQHRLHRISVVRLLSGLNPTHNLHFHIACIIIWLTEFLTEPLAYTCNVLAYV